MGQRLVITVKGGNEDIAKIYFHWSAYTHSALIETKKVIDCIYEHDGDETKKELQLRLIKFCEENGGGIKGDPAEFHYLQEMFPNETFKCGNYSRNYGLIAISKEGMADLQGWSEGDVTIYLDEDEEGISNTVFSWYRNIEEYNEDRKEWDDDFEGYKLEELPDIGCDLSEFGVDEIDDVINAIENINGVCRYGNEIFAMIE